MRRGINKGKAIRLLGEHLGLGPEQMMAFGDGYNDIEMLQAVRHSYVVGNTDADMRRYAAFTADTNDNLGIIKIIDRVLGKPPMSNGRH
jgi:hydroxymethylpyrimidine pyrophosphatase-like HAD family hydrolase